ncbi:Cloroperoxidase [Hypoxylon rubiginosum]|uniref:Cloroperoxidase n=1 Tax=Hypoxylon rubiginosum TaxID=110542 RepID=A0ACC0CWC7_9PEZI|nr:Cloroperoxidase [Hypoxylon rubiginosum]
MRITYISATIAFGTATLAQPPPPHPQQSVAFEPAGPGDVRSPCPILNAFANHGYLPHSGKAIDQNTTVNALKTALNIDPSFGVTLFNNALSTNPQPNAKTYDLDHLSRHNLGEHDGSLSRQDEFFGDQAVFDEAVFNQTMSFYTGDIITMQMAANARASRIMTSNLTNPNFTLSDAGSGASMTETALYVTNLGDKKAAAVPKSWIQYLFQNERLPYELGFKAQAEPYMADDLNNAIAKIQAAQHFPQSPGVGL